MFTLDVFPDIVNHCENLVKNKDIGRRNDGTNGNFEQQIVGMIGESVIRRAFGVRLPEISDDFDGGWDLEHDGVKIDVKTMSRTSRVLPEYRNTFFPQQEKFPSEVLLFTSYNKNTYILTVCGWIHKMFLEDRATFYKKGTIRPRRDGSTFKLYTDLYEILNSDLFGADSLEELQTQISHFSDHLTLGADR